MLTKTQIMEAEREAARMEDGGLKLATTQQPKLAVTSELEFAAAQELGGAIQCLERGERSGARVFIGRAIEKLNEAEIED